jgi:UDP-N-acetylmuramoyl-tripeptide--D-alanyl-D-alanine ligase
LFKHLAQNKGMLCVNCDDALVKEQSERYAGGTRCFYSLETRNLKNASHYYLVGQISADAAKLEVFGLENEPTVFSLPFPGKHNASNLLGAICMGHALGLNTQEIQDGLKSFTPPSGRSELHIWRETIRVYCDTYNANPISMKVALGLLEKISEKKALGGKTWACLGDMLELGTEEESLHRQLAPLIEKNQVDHVLLCGPKMQWLLDELKNRKFKGDVQFFETVDPIAEILKKDLAPNDIVLIKGSRGMRMERVWEAIR